MKSAIRNRFIKYSLTGGLTFGLDMLFLYFFINRLHWNPVNSAAAAFVLAVSLNYCASRWFVFTGTKRPLISGYVRFIGIALVGVLIVAAGMHILVEDLSFHYLISRTAVALLTGVWNFMLNMYFNFNVPDSA